jgi:5-methylcytosine-specific restriction enzyme subunit McrC
VRTETLIESSARELTLTDDQARALSQLGRRLASRKGWWKEPTPAEDRAVISCDPVIPGKWRVRVSDAVGVVSVPGLVVTVQPKINTAHLLFLCGESGALPRLDYQRAEVAAHASLWQLVAAWFVWALEALLRKDLIKDYRSVYDQLPLVRGSLDVVSTTNAFYRGKLDCACEFDEFDADTSSNRVLRAATLEIVGNPMLASDLRKRAFRLLARLENVGDLRPVDLRSAIDRRTAYYTDAIALARNVLEGTGRDLRAGAAPGWTFLLRTPDIVESGIRNVLRKGLASKWKVEKRGFQIGNSTMTLNPDLVFDEFAVGDVKYKVAEQWVRSDLYQAVTFAEGFGVKNAAVIGFASENGSKLPSLTVGETHLYHFQWRTDSATPPAEAAKALVSEVDSWLQSVYSVPQPRQTQGVS